MASNSEYEQQRCFKDKPWVYYEMMLAEKELMEERRELLDAMYPKGFYAKALNMLTNKSESDKTLDEIRNELEYKWIFGEKK